MPSVSSQRTHFARHQSKVHALIVAAGKGSRFGANIPKQYLPIADKTIVQHSVGKLAQSDYITHCHLVIAKDDNLAKTLMWDLPMSFVLGGAERWQSVQAGVSAIAQVAHEDDLVLIHDAARPCVPVTDINQVLEAAMLEQYGAILAMPVVDTLKKVDDNQTSLTTINREGLWQAQTPQVFRLRYLQEVLAHVQDSSLHITDEASGFEQLGYPIKAVHGSRANMKLTYPDDLMLLEAILQLEAGVEIDAETEVGHQNG